MLLYANALTGNNGLFTIAFAIVETESGETWYWFIENLNIAFGGGGLDKITLYLIKRKVYEKQ